MALAFGCSAIFSTQLRRSIGSFASFSLFTPRKLDGIAGTAPSYQSAIFLHSSVPPSAFPSRVKTPVSQELQLRLTKQGGFVNWVWYGDGLASRKHSATVFTAAGERIEIPVIDLQGMDAIEAELRRRVEQTPGSLVDEVHLFVCSHMARDCRCGERGGAFAKALREEVERRKALDPTGPYSRFKIGEVGHVGQHKYAPNLLVYPRGDWLGLLEIDDIPIVLEQAVETTRIPFLSNIGYPKEKWRGRMSLTKEEQLTLYNSSQ
ncbi:sucrase ferredoxin-like family protein [Moniliophthora roreri MCA 2997]|uniref:Sucrase ferredoxin-like family protein n=1 Tax=Moniliophthora roreri (strain MCA 2997) TaxID=1381753 RepID=V2XDT7_MONRO|nr:sucrase ferredoxin-like family protein [Moniliophthora roreri MCA 2997]